MKWEDENEKNLYLHDKNINNQTKRGEKNYKKNSRKQIKTFSIVKLNAKWMTKS
jgi:hypothetical protein